MNPDQNTTLNIAVSGQLTISREELEKLLQMPQPVVTPPAVVGQWPKDNGSLPRLAFTAAETAEILGVAPETIYRLLKRGLLRSSSALRHKIIARSEIERFLKETSRSAY